MGLEEGKKVLFSSYNGSLTLTPVDEEILKILRKVRGSGRELSPAEKRRRQKELKTMTQSELARKFGFNNLWVAPEVLQITGDKNNVHPQGQDADHKKGLRREYSLRLLLIFMVEI